MQTLPNKHNNDIGVNITATVTTTTIQAKQNRIIQLMSCQQKLRTLTACPNVQLH